jgi:DNA-binding NtrC family response regulator
MSESWDVLVIDDERVVRDAVKRVLVEEGLRVAAAADGASGLTHPALTTCKLVLVDLILPDRSGIEVLRALRAAQPRLPVVVITGYATHESTRRAFEAGAVDYLPKPFEAAELLAVVHRALEARADIAEETRP